MSINFRFTEFVYSLAAIVGVYFIFSLISLIIHRKYKTNRYRTPLVMLLIAVSTKIYFFFNIYQVDMRIIDTGIIILTVFAVVMTADTFVSTFYFTRKNIHIPKLLHNVIVGIIYFVTFFTVLKFGIGIDLTPLLTTSAVISMVIGLSLQSTLTDFIAGLVIHFEKPFKAGDWIKISGNLDGQVEEITWRATKLLTFDNDYLILPNSAVLRDSIINYNYPTTVHSLVMQVGVSYDCPPNRVKEVIMEVAKETRGVYKPEETNIRVVKYSDFSIDYDIRVFLNDYKERINISNDFMTKLWYGFKRNDIKIPYPIREIYQMEYPETKDIKDENLELLKRVDFFKNLDGTSLVDIVKAAKIVTYGRDEVLFYEKEHGDSFFIIKTGAVSVLIDDHEVARLHSGDFFGEMSLFTGKDRTATVMALEDSEFITLDKDSFRDIIIANRSIAEKISEEIANREIQNEKKLEKIKIKSREEYENERKSKDLRKNSIMNMISEFFNL